MKPRTRIQKEIAQLSKRLPKLSKAQRAYAFEHCFKHYAHRTKKGIITCLECGHQWKSEHHWRRAFAVILVLIVASSWKCWIPERECSENGIISVSLPSASSTRSFAISKSTCTARSDEWRNTQPKKCSNDGLPLMDRQKPLHDCVVIPCSTMTFGM